IKDTKRKRQKEIDIMEGALKVFGEKGYEEATISAISKAAKISDATLYEYFSSKEEILFSIPRLYTQRELDRVLEITRYIHGARERMRFIIQAYLEFYENNRLYTSVALLTLKGNRNFLKSESYQVVRKAARNIILAYNEGIEEGVFRDDIGPYLARNMILGFIEHLTIQWLLVGRPERITEYRDTIFDMAMRAIEKKKDADGIELKVRVEGLTIQTEQSDSIRKVKKEKK
ncbi:MAG: TetR/AcrR family transcriptional regulator, partial [Candidatus Abyssubacteria bacterium]|nr:TetR/AcrR family transcriptional regulator [Candidatus Abyssubacteria bacterium]